MTDFGTTKTGRTRKRPTLTHVNIRLPLWVFEYYKGQPNYTRAMREVLTMHAQDALSTTKEEQ